MISQTVAADMSAAHGMVRARISSDASQTFLDIGWMDKGSLADGYKVYIKLAIQSGTFWSDIAPSDTDPAPQRYANTSSTVFPVGNSYTVRIRHGGTDQDTGTLIGEVTTTVVAPGSTPPRTRSVFAYLSDRDDGNAGTKLTVTWTDDQTCATKYQVGHYIEAVSQYSIPTAGSNLPSNAVRMTHNYDYVINSVRVRVICGPSTQDAIVDLTDARLIGDVTATR